MPPAPENMTSDALRVAVLEDDDDLREKILLPGLRDFGFTVTGAGSAGELYRHMLARTFDIIVLDIGLPDEDGLSVAAHLRTTSDVGLVMLTASREKHDHVRALQESVDAFLGKPVDVEILAATLHSLARRLRPDANLHAAGAQPDWRLEGGGWRLVSPDDKIIALTAPEHSVLTTLMDARGDPVSREALIEKLTSNIYDFDPHRLEMMIHRLRRKVEKQVGAPLPLVTVRGAGYLFAGDADA